MLLTADFAIAQKGYFEAGFIIRNNDTIPGFIERNAEADLGRSIKYKEYYDSERYQEFLPSGITGFGFGADNIWFEALEVEIKNEINFARIRRFGKVLLKGHTNLYKVQLLHTEYDPILLKDNTYVYVIMKDDAYYTLGQFEYMVGNAVGLNRRYIGTLTYLLRDCQTALQNINSLGFKDQAITKLIQQYNACASPETNTINYTYKRNPVIRHGFELAYTTVNYKILSVGGYSIGYFLDTYKPDLSKRVSGRLGISYNYFKTEINGSNEPDALAHIIKIPMAFQLNLGTSPQSRYLPFLQAGINEYVYLTEKHMFTTLAVGAGLYIRHIKLACSFEKEDILNQSPTIVNLSVGLRLDRVKE